MVGRRLFSGTAEMAWHHRSGASLRARTFVQAGPGKGKTALDSRLPFHPRSQPPLSSCLPAHPPAPAACHCWARRGYQSAGWPLYCAVWPNDSPPRWHQPCQVAVAQQDQGEVAVGV